MQTKTLTSLSIILPLLILFTTVAYPISQFFTLRSGASFTYALDDPYIHMAIAQNLIQHGVYGVTPDGFTSSSSSILWVLLLSGVYALFGVSDTAPLWLNLVSATLVVILAWYILRRAASLRPLLILAGLIVLIFFIPLVPQVISGMETTLQIALTLAFAALSAHVLIGTHNRSSTIALLILGFLFSAIRFESLAFIALVCLLLLLQRRWKVALALGAAALLPVVVYGLISVQNGWLFLPNSVLVKTMTTAYGWTDPIKVLIERLDLLWEKEYLRVLFFPALFTLLLEWKWPTAPAFARWLLLFFPPVLLVQVLFGQLGWFYRYEAYALALGILALLSIWVAWLGQIDRQSFRTITINRAFLYHWFRPVLALIMTAYAFFHLSSRATDAWQDSPGAMTNIYDQQVQMARFLKTYYAGSCVAINDIGAISYIGDVCVVDLFGLATQETARAYLDRRPLRPTIEAVCQKNNVRIAIVYTHWFFGSLPYGWVRIGTWQLDQLVVTGGDVVTFFATSPAEVAPLRQHLLDFAPRLPSAVVWEVY